MKNKKFGLGILVMILVFGMAVVGNLEAQEENGGEFILTDLPKKYNGKYAYLMSSHTYYDDGEYNLTFSSYEDLRNPQYSPIIDGKVVLPLWVTKTGTNGNQVFERYSGNNNKVIVMIFIVNYEKPYTGSGGEPLEVVVFSQSSFGPIPTKDDTITFSNGKATRSYKQRSTKK